MELARSYLFAIMAYGPHGKLSPNFNWGSISVPASGTPLVFATRMVGFFGLTFLVLVINICIYSLVTRYYRGRSIAALCIVFCLTYISWSAGVHVKTPELTVVAVGVGPTQGLKDWDQASWPAQGTDLLVLPEYSEILKNPQYKEIMNRLSDTGLAVTTIRDKGSPEGTNRLIYINKKGDIVNYQDKTFLIPTGEYLPYSLQASFKLIGKQKSIQDFKYTQQQTNGKIDEYPFSGGSFRVGALACSGVSALNEYKRLSSEDADILVNSASLSFLAPHSHYHVYARNMARYHAVSNNKPFVQASRSGETYRISNQGEITYL
jgi:apolipoprotein N-acyltransferase